MDPKLLPPTRVTTAQRVWLEAEQTRTGNSLAATIRNLIQDKLEHLQERAAKNGGK